MEDRIDYLKFYDDEQYLLAAGDNFRLSGHLESVDFYMMLVWKANRAKNYHRDRLKRLSGKSFEEAVSRIASRLHRQAEPYDRLKHLMQDWEFALPTASAVLTLLYPQEFTVYDIVVCRELDVAYKPWPSFSSRLWADYQDYKQLVIEATPTDLSLRDKDRFLIGRAYRKDVEQQVKE